MLLQSKENLEELAVKLLAKKQIMSATEIHNKTGKKYSLQAVYKELRKLQSGGVVVKVKQAYSLRLPWVLDFVTLAETMSQTHFDLPILTSILFGKKKKEIWHFNNLFKLNDFWSHILLILIQQSPKKVLLGYNPHLWFHLAQTKQEEQYIKSLGLAKSKLYLIVGGNTYLDKWAEKFFDKRIVNYYFGRNLFGKDNSIYFNVIDDYILTIKLDNKITEAIENLYKNNTSLEEINFSSILNIFRCKVKASIWLEKNFKKAEKLENKFSRFFGVKF